MPRRCIRNALVPARKMKTGAQKWVIQRVHEERKACPRQIFWRKKL
jgi:hypothetical protein